MIADLVALAKMGVGAMFAATVAGGTGLYFWGRSLQRKSERERAERAGRDFTPHPTRSHLFPRE